MKLKAAFVLVVALAAGAGAFAWRAVRIEKPSSAPTAELRWLQREFALNDDAMRRIGELHRSYTGECEKMCEALRASDAEVSQLVATGKRTTPALENALSRSNQLTADCQRRMVEHFYAVAKEMPAPQAQRYLQLMTPVITHPEGGWMKLVPQ
jgi:hypothetical protein